MAKQWMGFTISIDCGPMGKFQGVVTAVEAEPQSVTLSRVFHNGIPHTSPSIVISAHDIKDLTIIAAPQAQIDPIVKLKKPIPTRPERNVNEGVQNFHSQPAPPRALHLAGSDFDTQKAAALLGCEQGAHQSKSQALPKIGNGLPLELNGLQAALYDALKVSNSNQVVSSAAAPASLHTAVKLSAAQTVSQRALQLGRQQSAQAARETQTMAAPHGGFKMTAALSSNGPASPQKAGLLHFNQAPSVGSGSMKLGAQAPFQAESPISPQKARPLNESQVALSFGSGSGAQALKAPKPSQTSSLKNLLLNATEAHSLGSATQALLRGNQTQMLSQGAVALPRSQGSPQKNAHKYQQQGFQAALNSLQVNTDGYASGSGDGNRTPNKRDRLRQRWQARDEACFGSPANDQEFDEEFDFEKNLALFDKQAVYDEIAVQRPDLVQPANDQRRQQNYRHDQNILVNNRRIPSIIVPNPGSAEYVTDEGLIIPSMRPELLRQLHQKAHDVGFTFDRQSEVFARCATEMSLQLLGGAHRLNPHNSHQWPTVIVMVGPHSQGAAGVMCARQLECQGVSTVTLVVNEAAAPPLMKRELNFYKCGGAPIVNNTDQLPDTVDLVIMALAGHLPTDVSNSLEYGKAASWACNKRAPVLALDPPPVGTPGIITKFALAPTLPVTYSPQNGKVYLCNLGVPIVVFKEMGIRYRSPFGSKFVIPLHPNDE
ncbi:enhancer of mRNA-decapping protein 3 isoform X2 [Thrips palmi]|nr:enhancer of mRNA-decapping protein 3 isoform X2 [Thrips palmi]